MAQPAPALHAVPLRLGRYHEHERPLHAFVPESAPVERVNPAVRWGLRLAILAIAMAAPVLAFAGERKVALDVEGNVHSVRTYATNADELLERKGIESGGRDLVAPGHSLTEGDKVVFRRAKRIELVVDGQRRIAVVRGLTVRDALADLGMVPGPRDHVYPAPSSTVKPRMELFVRNAVRAKVRVDGHLRDVVSSADTVRNLLLQAGVPLGRDDYVFPARDTEPRSGMWIRVVRVRRITQERTVRIPFRYITQRDSSMESGVRKTIQQGSEGSKVQRFRVVLEDGRRVSRTMLGERVTRSPRDYIVRVGTREPTFKGGGASQQGLASWYTGDGLVAAHRSLPIGSVVRVTNLDNGRTVNVRITNRGPWVDGRVIDLSSDAFGRLAPLGKGTIRVKVQS